MSAKDASAAIFSSLRPSPDLKAKALSLARDWLAAERRRLENGFLKSGDAEAMLAGTSAAMDALLKGLYDIAPTARVALAATGGYGRGELFPYSDIDLLFLHDGKEEKEAARMAEFILYILWDLGLAVGQAHRSLNEAITLSRRDMTIRTNLIDARFVAGSQDLFDRFQARFTREVAEGTSLEFVEAKLAERDARHLRFGDSRYMLEPNIKEGKGGLRDLHTLWWIARYLYPIRRIHDLVPMKLLTQDEYRAFDQARAFLCRVRIHLHLQAGRAEERLSFDRQPQLAAAMGFKHPSANRAIERFMRRYFVAVRTVGATTRVFCALLEEEKKRKPRRPFAWLQRRWKLSSFKLDGERLNVRSPRVFELRPQLMIEMFKVAQAYDLDIHPHALQLMARSLKRIDGRLQGSPRANAAFLDIMLSDKGPEVALRRMSEAGVLGRFIPEFGRIIGQTQFNMYHVYTVDEHTLVALGILFATEKGLLKNELPMSTEIMARVQMKRVLYLALFCHDIAKGRSGDHSVLGEKTAFRLAVRFGFSDDEADTAAWLVRHHLLFSHTAFRRDIDDPKTVQDFVEIVRTPERLKLLLVLTAADMRATSPSVWNAWKGALLRDLYRRAEQRMGSGEAMLKNQQAGLLKADLLKLLPDWKERDVAHYLEQGAPGFQASFDPLRHAMLARMVRQAEGMPLPILMDTRHEYEHSITEIVIITYDQHGLFSKIAGAMALSGANITGAKIFTLKNGTAVDVFQVQDGSGQVFDRPDRLAKLSVYIEQALAGEIDLAQAFSEHPSHASPRRDAMPVPGQVFIDNEASNLCSVIEISGRDRTGFLYQVTRTMAELGLTIATAHISTYGTQAADVFYVKDVFGMKITHEVRLKEIRAALMKIIGSEAITP